MSGATPAVKAEVSAPHTPRAPKPSRSGSPPTRKDIQGLRTIAVLSVLVYHFWPNRVTGGYVGVDVFFVISGFLISAHLYTHVPTTGRLLLKFWARRVRRLLPAATIVLLATVVASLVWLPSTMVPRAATEAAAAAVYVENWALADTATDYLASQDAPSPLQHYWSLSVEEQFYVVWPILIGGLVLLGMRSRYGKALLPIGLTGVFVVSLGYSAWLTQVDPARAYFVTPTRMWELALGALVALVGHLGWRLTPRPHRLVASWLGLGLIAWSVFRFDSGTAFPGLAALIPTVGTALVILAATDDVPGSPRVLLSPRPAQFIGDISYSIYLWHWPIIVIAPYAAQGDVRAPLKVVLIAAAIALAAATKKWVEDPMRTNRVLLARLSRTFAMGGACIAVVLALSGAVLWQAGRATAAELEAVDNARRSAPECFGAAAADNDQCAYPSTKLVTSPSVARDDKPDVYADGCWNGRPFTGHTVCSYGPSKATVRVALIGNSHAGHWHPILARLAKEKGWRLDTYLASECYTVDVPLSFATPGLGANCSAWNAWAIAEITRGKYDLVVMSDRSRQPLADVPEDRMTAVAQASYGRVLGVFVKSGARVHVMRDVPGAGRNAPDCVAAHPADWGNACTFAQAQAVEPDPLAAAARADASGKVSVTDLTPVFCRSNVCHSVIGGVIAYFDHGHLTKTFADTLYPEVAPALIEAVSR